MRTASLRPSLNEALNEPSLPNPLRLLSVITWINVPAFTHRTNHIAYVYTHFDAEICACFDRKRLLWCKIVLICQILEEGKKLVVDISKKHIWPETCVLVYSLDHQNGPRNATMPKPVTQSFIKIGSRKRFNSSKPAFPMLSATWWSYTAQPATYVMCHFKSQQDLTIYCNSYTARFRHIKYKQVLGWYTFILMNKRRLQHGLLLYLF